MDLSSGCGNRLTRVEDLVKVTTYLTNGEQVEANSRIRQQQLGTAKPALTVLIVQTLDSQWLLEVEAIAAAKSNNESASRFRSTPYKQPHGATCPD
jgi:enamine deaminase RidA (YjgF/YER057c/UK114 family)